MGVAHGLGVSVLSTTGIASFGITLNYHMILRYRALVLLTEKGLDVRVCPSACCRNSERSQTNQISWHTKHHNKSNTCQSSWRKLAYHNVKDSQQYEYFSRLAKQSSWYWKSGLGYCSSSLHLDSEDALIYGISILMIHVPDLRTAWQTF